MKYRKLVASDLEVSEISLGSWLTYGVGVARENAVACVDRAFEPGINFIDTANVYGRGAAETFLGEVLASRHVDLYQCHRYDSGTPIEETMQALSKVVRDGKARYIGFSEWSPQQVEGAGAVAGTERFVSSREGDFPDRLVAAGAGRAVGQVRARRGRPARAPAMRPWASSSSPGSPLPSWAPCRS